MTCELDHDPKRRREAWDHVAEEHHSVRSRECKEAEVGKCSICLKNCQEAGVAKSESMRQAVGTMKAKGTKDFVGHSRVLAPATQVFLLSLKPHSHLWALSGIFSAKHFSLIFQRLVTSLLSDLSPNATSLVWSSPPTS